MVKIECDNPVAVDICDDHGGLSLCPWAAEDYQQDEYYEALFQVPMGYDRDPLTFLGPTATD